MKIEVNDAHYKHDNNVSWPSAIPIGSPHKLGILRSYLHV